MKSLLQSVKHGAIYDVCFLPRITQFVIMTNCVIRGRKHTACKTGASSFKITFCDGIPRPPTYVFLVSTLAPCIPILLYTCMGCGGVWSWRHNDIFTSYHALTDRSVPGKKHLNLRKSPKRKRGPVLRSKRIFHQRILI